MQLTVDVRQSTKPPPAPADTGRMPRKTIRPSVRQIERWQRAAELAGVSLSELITAATEARVDQIEREHAEDVKLDEWVRAEVDAAITKRSSVMCGCAACRR